MAPRYSNRNQEQSMKEQTVITEMCTFRIPTDIVDHLTAAHKESELTKTTIVRRALREHLEKNYPLKSEEPAVH